MFEEIYIQGVGYEYVLETRLVLEMVVCSFCNKKCENQKEVFSHVDKAWEIGGERVASKRLLKKISSLAKEDYELNQLPSPLPSCAICCKKQIKEEELAEEKLSSYEEAFERWDK